MDETFDADKGTNSENYVPSSDYSSGVTPRTSPDSLVKAEKMSASVLNLNEFIEYRTIKFCSTKSRVNFTLDLEALRRRTRTFELNSR